ncbi:DNA binding domain-containing protein, excisionase family [Actinokineospora alba]|uniref:DNA binding domain-containing protein, excisionase family n=1 Tax=Actinokineospora alba TaxID=504798 RepID=A0A1H0WQL1_9PSEU|nr:helix-turn-helix domain-containing protein [Actinokineospora alba]TDP65452.1 AlpA family transcriptional regulator [Actinokineospora alba]SDH62579.1 DNA binding domain-containing protein, excisionase family [Actinokineospora alba]SDP92735.1 DNA binding domain-containing protein, excisionase family [Actinokineospora alba]
MDHDTFDQLLSTPELCAYLKITRDTLYEWREINAAPPAFKLPNGHLRFPMADLLDWIAKQRGRAA